MLALRGPANRPLPTPPRDADAPAPPPTLHELVVAPPDGSPPLTVDELLTGWLSNLHRSIEPDTYAEFNDYAKHVERVCRMQQAADCICRELDNRIADWVKVEGADGSNPRRPPRRRG